MGKVVLELLDDGERGIVRVDAKDNFVVRIVLAAKACEVLIGLGVKAEDRLEIADGRQEAGRLEAGRPEIPKTAKDRDAIVDKRDRRYREECCSDCGPGHQDNTLNQLTI